MKKLILAASLFITSIAAKAQMPYNVTTFTQPYLPLATTATTLNNNTVWDDNAEYTLPLGFNFRVGNNSYSSLSLLFSGLATTGATGLQSGFAFLSTALIDRGYADEVSRSPIRYATTGTAGNRIFKLEYVNAGFAEEKDAYGTNLDSINMQVWFYEDRSAVEFRFGSSRISHFDKYFGEKSFTAFIRNLNLTSYNLEKAYILTDNPASPVLDSATAYTDAKGLNSMPASGTVYRFTPKTATTGIPRPQQQTLARIYPTQCSSGLTIEHSSKSPLNYRIINAMGVEVGQGTAAAGKSMIDVAALPAGNYFLRLTDVQNECDAQRFTKI